MVEGWDKYYIDTVIDKNTVNKCRLTGFYGQPNTTRRLEAWTKLRVLNSWPKKPWLCYRDFNKIIRQDEKLGGCKKAL